MKRICPILFDWTEQESAYPFSSLGLKKLSPHLRTLKPLDFTQQGIRTLAEAQNEHFRFPGNQPKLAMRLEVKQSRFQTDPHRGRYLIKAQHPSIEKIPENEAITLHLAAIAGIETAACGLIDTIDDSFALWSRRVDRIGQSTRLDLVRLASLIPDHSASATTETLIQLIDQHTTFPVKEKSKFYRIFLFNFLVANAQMHAGKWHLLTDKNNITSIAPLFGVRNTLLYESEGLESSLPLGDNGTRLDKKWIYEYLGKELLQLPETHILKVSREMLRHAIAWKLAIDRSYLSPTQKFDYQQILNERVNRLR